MKRNILIFVMLLVFSAAFVFEGCKEEPVAYEEFAAFTVPELVAPLSGAYVDLEGETTVDLQWSSTNADGDPQNWDVHFGKSEEPAIVASNYTSQTYTATVEIGTKYYWYVVGYDKKGIPTESEIWNFEVIDPEASLVLNMEWSTDVLDAIGIDVPPEEACNLRLKIVDKATGATYATVNSNSFETYPFTKTVPDGDYLIVTDLYSTINAGDFNNTITISVNLKFNQRGILSQIYPYPNVMTNSFTCDSYFTVLAEVNKDGSTYTIKNVGEAAWAADLPSLVGTWTGPDNMGYDDVVNATLTDDTLYVYGICFGWMEDWWGEPVQSGNPVPLIFDYTSLGSVIIEDQYYITTTYGGDPYDYNIVGTGMLSLCGDDPILTITYDIKYSADGWSIGAYVKHLFVVELTLGAKGKGYEVISAKQISPAEKMLPPIKPVR